MKKQEKNMGPEKKEEKGSGLYLVIPFFIVLGVLTVISFLIPLRPSQLQMEKRNLAEFPEFSWAALGSGEYFDDITFWFSDTFPGRESWIALSSGISSFHGNAEVAFSGDLGDTEDIPVIPMPTQPVPEAETEPEASEYAAEVPADDPVQTQPVEIPEETTESAWGGVDAGENVDSELNGRGVIQIGDTAFNSVGFSQICSDRYAKALSGLADKVLEDGVRVVSAPAPTAVGIMIEPENLTQFKCADQNQMIQYLHGSMSSNVIKVDTYAALVAHNDEYIYFRTDHHWTARGAYYAYEAICEALGYEPVPLEECEVWDQGDFEGSLYWKAPNPKKLRMDTLIAYIPKGDFEMRVRKLRDPGTVRPLIQDVTQRKKNAKYNAFLFSDNAMVEVTNSALPDGPSCLVVKDSFGNPLVPFLAQNYHKVYAIDYRKFNETTVRGFMNVHQIDDVIFTPYVTAIQAQDGSQILANKCK